MGPGAHFAKRLKRGDPGSNRLDKIAKLKQHDIDYSHAKTLNKWPETVVKNIMKTEVSLNMWTRDAYFF